MLQLVPTGAAPASLIPVVAVVFICGLSDDLINEYLFYFYFIYVGCIYSDNNNWHLLNDSVPDSWRRPLVDHDNHGSQTS